MKKEVTDTGLNERIYRVKGYSPELSLERLEKALTSNIKEAEEVVILSMTGEKGPGWLRRILGFGVYVDPMITYYVDLKIHTSDGQWHQFKNGKITLHSDNTDLCKTLFLSGCKSGNVELAMVQIKVEDLGMRAEHAPRIIR